MARRPVHRLLRLGASGPDVKQLQYGINRKARGWKLERFVVTIDGDLGPQTLNAATKLLYAMGAHGRVMQRARAGYLSEYAQRLLRGTRPRTKAMKALSLARRPKVRTWRLTLGEWALREAERCVGIVEQGGNNRGPEVEQIIREGGGVPGQAWCGWFCAAMYKRAGSKAVTWAWGAVRLLWPLAGIKRVSSPRPGDLVRFTFDHVGLFVRDLGNGTIETIEGNTGDSGARSDSVTGGDGVKRKVRSKALVRDYLRVTR